VRYVGHVTVSLIDVNSGTVQHIAATFWFSTCCKNCLVQVTKVHDDTKKLVIVWRIITFQQNLYNGDLLLSLETFVSVVRPLYSYSLCMPLLTRGDTGELLEELLTSTCMFVGPKFESPLFTCIPVRTSGYCLYHQVQHLKLPCSAVTVLFVFLTSGSSKSCPLLLSPHDYLTSGNHTWEVSGSHYSDRGSTQ
jgi:hypothetical protein